MSNRSPVGSQPEELKAFASELGSRLGLDSAAVVSGLTDAALRVCRESMPLDYALRSALGEHQDLTLSFARFLTNGPGLDVMARICEKALIGEGEPLPITYCRTRLQAEAEAILALEHLNASDPEVERLLLNAQEVVPLKDIALDYTIGSAIDVIIIEHAELRDALRIGFSWAIENGFLSAKDPRLGHMVDWKHKRLADDITEDRFHERLTQVLRNEHARRGYAVEAMRSISRTGKLVPPEVIVAKLLEALK